MLWKYDMENFGLSGKGILSPIGQNFPYRSWHSPTRSSSDLPTNRYEDHEDNKNVLWLTVDGEDWWRVTGEDSDYSMVCDLYHHFLFQPTQHVLDKWRRRSFGFRWLRISDTTQAGWPGERAIEMVDVNSVYCICMVCVCTDVGTSSSSQHSTVSGK